MESLKPQKLWSVFGQICQIPHGSGNTDELRSFLKKLCEDHGLSATEFNRSGNLFIIKKADPGFENVPIVCLEAHMDMVCSKRSDCDHNFETDPIRPRICDVEGKRVVTATGTTLGADDGIGVAACLAIAFDKSIETGELEILLTKDEETSMFGVANLGDEPLRAKYLLNLDSEELGVITIGSAGGFCQLINFNNLPVEKVSKEVRITVSNCSGGHSGGDIHLFKAHAIKLIARMLAMCGQQVKICSINGGTADNAIPMDCVADICVEDMEAFETFVEQYEGILKTEFESTDPLLRVVLSKTEAGESISLLDSEKIIDFLNVIPSSVLRMSQDVQGLTESSINVGIIKFDAQKTDNFILLHARSSINTYLTYVEEQLEALVRMSGIFSIEPIQDAYGGWKPNTESELLAISERIYGKILEQKVRIEAVHAGLECAEIMTKYESNKMEAISIGPTIMNPHSDKEYIEIDTVEPFYEVVKHTIIEISSRK